MIWLDSIYDLQFYNPIPGVPCFCEEIVNPNDLQLQALLYNGANPYTVTIYAYSADGLTNYGNVSTYFATYTAKTPTGQDYFNTKLDGYAPAMCTNKCFILRVTVTSGGQTIFDKYTERYCVSSCCVTASGVTFQQEGLQVTLPGGPTNGIPISTSRPVSECGTPLIRIISRFDCIDSFTGNFFGDPAIVYSGTADWNYTLVTSCKGRIVRRPRDIQREISYNCKLQKSESAPTYLLEAYEYFPAWKMFEIEGQLHSNHIWIDDYVTYKEYVFNGGTPFKKVEGANSCTEVFKLETPINECIQRQIFGCNPVCNTLQNNGYLIIPDSYVSGGWYDENGILVANVYDGYVTSPFTMGLLQWIRAQPGVTDVEEVDITGAPCEPYTYSVVKIEGSGLLSGSVYYNSPINANRLFVRTITDEDELCSFIGPNPCESPTLGTITVSAMACGAPVFGTIVISDITPTTLTILALPGWIAEPAPDTEASLYYGQVTWSFEGTKTVAATNGTLYTILAEPIASISSAGWPIAARTMDSSNSALTGDQTIVMGTDGILRVSGTFNITVDNELTFDFDNFVYSI